MKERPILYSAPMVLAVNRDIKIHTRRLYKVCKHPDIGCEMAACELAREPQHVIDRACPYGQPGDRLYVREAWRTDVSLDFMSGTAMAEAAIDAGYAKPWAPIQYEADQSRRDWNRVFGVLPSTPGRYRHARFMPRWASRTTLEITGVRIERLQDISEADCRAEGCAGGHGSIPGYAYNATPSEHFQYIWQSVGGDWAANPWVWVIEFKRIK